VTNGEGFAQKRLRFAAWWEGGKGPTRTIKS